MSSLKEVVQEAGVGNLHAVLTSSSGDKHVCYTLLTPEPLWVVGVTDGCELWRLEFDLDEIDAHRDLADISTVEVFLSRIKSAFMTCDLQINQTSPSVVTLCIGHASKALDVKLYEAKAIDKKTEMQHLFLRFAELSLDLETKLEKANASLESLKGQKTSKNLFDLDDSKKKTNAKFKPKQAGMSVVNPGSKKRKVVKGVEFE